MGRERRAHARVAVPLNARIVVGKEEVELLVRDVSRRGLFLYTKRSFGPPKTVLTLKLALTPGIKPLLVRAEIIRNVGDGEKGTGELIGMGMRFVDLSADAEEQLLGLIDRALRGRGTRMRAFPRVYKLLEVSCKTHRDLRGLLRDIGEGGCGLTVDEPVPLNETVLVTVPRQDGPGLTLEGWVVACEPLAESEGHYRVGVRFGRLKPQTRGELEAFIRTLMRR